MLHITPNERKVEWDVCAPHALKAEVAENEAKRRDMQTSWQESFLFTLSGIAEKNLLK